MKQAPIKLHGLTAHQAELADMLWDCETMEEVKLLLNYCLTDEDRNMALVLIEMIHMEAAERDGELEKVAPVVDKLLHKIMNEAYGS